MLRTLLVKKDGSGRRVAAGMRVALREDAERVSGLRLLAGCFMAIEHALVVPLSCSASACAAILRFVTEPVEGGFSACALLRFGIEEQRCRLKAVGDSRFAPTPREDARKPKTAVQRFPRI